MSGVRFTLTNNTAVEQLHLDRAQLGAAMADLAQIEEAIPELQAGPEAPYRVQGTAACWRPAHPIRILCPSYRVGPDWSGMTVAAYGGPAFDFPDHRPSELAALIELAITGLESR
ncbi:MAG: hypothetical protein WAW79_06340 [Steroidobacteraceae bacterium]